MFVNTISRSATSVRYLSNNYSGNLIRTMSMNPIMRPFPFTFNKIVVKPYLKMHTVHNRMNYVPGSVSSSLVDSTDDRDDDLKTNDSVQKPLQRSSPLQPITGFILKRDFHTSNRTQANETQRPLIEYTDETQRLPNNVANILKLNKDSPSYSLQHYSILLLF